MLQSVSCRLIRAWKPLQLSSNLVALPTRCCSNTVEDNDKRPGNLDKADLKKLSNKARVIELKRQRNAAVHNAKKFLNKNKQKKTVYDVHENMSVRDISQLTGAPIDILLDVVLSHVSFLNMFAFSLV